MELQPPVLLSPRTPTATFFKLCLNVTFEAIFPPFSMDDAVKIFRRASQQFVSRPLGNFLPVAIEDIQRVAVVHVFENHEVFGVKGPNIGAEAVSALDKLFDGKSGE